MESELKKVVGIVVKSVDYKDNDKIITILTDSLGILNAKLKGVKKNNAKLKFVSSPFCFGEFQLTKNEDFYTVIGCDIIDSFFELTSDYDKFETASKILIISKLAIKPNMDSGEILILIVESLKVLLYENVNFNLVLIKFLIEIFKFSGFDLQIENCDTCGKKIVGDCYISRIGLSVACDKCKSGSNLILTVAERNIIKSLKEISINDMPNSIFLQNCKNDILESILKVFDEYYKIMGQI